MTSASGARGRPRIIAIGFNIDGTGLTRVMRSVLGGLATDYRVDYVGIGYAGPVTETGGVRMHPANPRGGDVFGAFQALEMIGRDPPEAVLIVHDIWLFGNYGRVLEPVRNRTKFIGYLPLDGNIVDERVALPLHCLDRVVVYTEWAAEQLAGAFGRLRATGPGQGQPRPPRLPPLPRIDVIPHGVDVTAFQARPELVAAGFDRRGRAATKRRVFPALTDPGDSFVVLNASRPDNRKRVDITIEAFAEFAEGKPAGVRLCLHQGITDAGTADLLTLARTLGIADRLLYNPLSPDGGVLADDDLALLYSACDVGINTSMGEGWGLVSFEHAATGAAQIVPGHSACRDLWRNGTAMLVEPAERGIPPFSPLEMARVDAAGAAAAMETLYRDRVRLRRVSRAGCAYARRPGFRWEAIADRWRAVFSDVIGLTA